MENNYVERVFTQIYRDLCGDAWLLPITIDTNIGGRNQQNYLSLSLLQKREFVFLDELKNH